jgi:hypothetical protein
MIPPEQHNAAIPEQIRDTRQCRSLIFRLTSKLKWKVSRGTEKMMLGSNWLMSDMSRLIRSSSSDVAGHPVAGASHLVVIATVQLGYIHAVDRSISDLLYSLS